MRFAYLCLFLTVFNLYSCGEDEDNFSDEDLLGTWEIVSATTKSESTTTASGISATAVTTSVLVQPSDFRWIFESGPNRLRTDGSVTLDATTTANGQTFSAQIGGDQSLVGNVGWERNGNTLTFTEDNGDSSEGKIITLSETELTISFRNETTKEIQGATNVTVQEGTYQFVQ